MVRLSIAYLFALPHPFPPSPSRDGYLPAKYFSSNVETRNTASNDQQEFESRERERETRGEGEEREKKKESARFEQLSRRREKKLGHLGRKQPIKV